ncbi:hypothetical protein BDV28DRAFT_130579, partial [Aspergillus coremiiformis]
MPLRSYCSPAPSRPSRASRNQMRYPVFVGPLSATCTAFVRSGMVVPSLCLCSPCPTGSSCLYSLWDFPLSLMWFRDHPWRDRLSGRLYLCDHCRLFFVCGLYCVCALLEMCLCYLKWVGFPLASYRLGWVAAIIEMGFSCQVGRSILYLRRTMESLACSLRAVL